MRLRQLPLLQRADSCHFRHDLPPRARVRHEREREATRCRFVSALCAMPRYAACYLFTETYAAC